MGKWLFTIRIARPMFAFIALLFSGVPIILSIFYFVSTAPQGLDYAAYNVPLGSVLLLVGVGIAFVLFKISGDKADVFERGIVQTRRGKKTVVRFEEVSSVVRVVIDVRITGSLTGTRQTHVVMNTLDRRTIDMFHNSVVRTWNENLDRACQMAVNAVADRMQRTLESNGSVAWLKTANVSASIRPAGLAVGSKFFEFARMEMEAAYRGTCRVSANGSLLFEVNAGATNFYPGIQLIKRLRGEPVASRLDSMLGDVWHTATAVSGRP